MKIRILFLLVYLFTINIAFSQDFGGVLEFYQKGNYGLVDSLGTIIVPAEYKSIQISENKKYIVLQKEFNEMEGEIYSYQSCSDCGKMNQGDPYIYYKSGILNAKLDTVFPFEKNNIEAYKNFFFIGERRDFSVLDENFNRINSVNYEEAVYISQPYSGLWYRTTTGFYGVIDKNGNQLMKEMPLWIQPLADNLFVTQIKAQYFFVDKKLKKVHDFSFSSFEFLNPKIILFDVGEQYNKSQGLIDTKGNILLPAEYYQILYDEQNKVYIVKTKDYKTGILDNDLKEIVPFEYNQIVAGKGTELFLVYKDKKFGFMNGKGKMIIPMIYDGADIFSEGLAPVLKNGKWGFINEKGETVIDFKFDGRMKSFENGYATFYQGNQSVFINKKGEKVGELGDHDYDIKYYSKDKGIRVKFQRYYGGRLLIDLKTGEVIFYLG